MKRSILRGTASEPSRSFGPAITDLHGEGVFDDPRRTGAVIAVTTLLVASGAIAVATMTGAGAGPTEAPAWTSSIPDTQAPTAGHKAGGSTQAAAPRGPRVVDTSVASKASRPQAPATEPPALPRVRVIADTTEPDSAPLQAPAHAPPHSTGAIAAARTTAGKPENSDTQTTGAIASRAKAGTGRADPVPVADSEDQVVALEARMTAASPYFKQPNGKNRTPVETGTATAAAGLSEPAASPSATVTTPKTSPMPSAAPPPHATASLEPATATTWVKLHAGPGNDAKVVATVPGKAAIKAETGCKFWCQAEYKGQFGYIYKDFVKRPGQSETVAASQ